MYRIAWKHKTKDKGGRSNWYEDKETLEEWVKALSSGHPDYKYWIEEGEDDNE
jgi:hypothetical protein